MSPTTYCMGIIRTYAAHVTNVTFWLSWNNLNMTASNKYLIEIQYMTHGYTTLLYTFLRKYSTT